jgi:hypothetical protein
VRRSEGAGDTNLDVENVRTAAHDTQRPDPKGKWSL